MSITSTLNDYANGTISRADMITALTSGDYTTGSVWHPFHEFRHIAPDSYDELALAYFMHRLNDKDLHELKDAGLPITNEIITAWSHARTMYDRVAAAYRGMFPGAQHNRRAQIVSGGPASGKTTAIEENMPGAAESCVVLDPEYITGTLLRYYLATDTLDARLPQAVKDFQDQGNTVFPMEVSFVAAEDSAKLAAIMLRTLAAEGVDLVIETTMVPAAVGQQILDVLADNGYEVSIVEQHATKEEALERAEKRFKKDYDEAIEILKNGQLTLGPKPVVPDYFEYVYTYQGE